MFDYLARKNVEEIQNKVDECGSGCYNIRG
jgi:hypothetical protein